MSTEFVVKIPSKDLERLDVLVKFLRVMNVEFASVDSPSGLEDELCDTETRLIWDKDISREFMHTEKDIENKHKERLIEEIISDMRQIRGDIHIGYTLSILDQSEKKSIIVTFDKPLSIYGITGQNSYEYKIEGDRKTGIFTISLDKDPHNILSSLMSRLSTSW